MGRPISVAITTYNGAAFIREQLQSVLAQNIRPAQIVVADDGSTDDTLAILREYRQQGQIELLEREGRPLGVLKNFQRAVAACCPEYDIALCDQDDVWLPQKLEKSSILLQAAELKKPGPAMSFSDLRLVDEELHTISASFWEVLRIDPSKERLPSLLFGNIVTGCTILMNPAMRSIMLAMPTQHVMMHDAWLGLVAFSFGAYEFSREPLVLYRQHGRNVTGATNTTQNWRQRLLKNKEQFSKSRTYLQRETQMALAFLKANQEYLSASDADLLYQFSRMAESTWLSKKILSLYSRSYRLKHFIRGDKW
jgi:glycosyltransferase involved in cell wall biosynthesis